MWFRNFIPSLICCVLCVVFLPRTKQTLILSILSLSAFSLVSFLELAFSFGSNISAGAGMAMGFSEFLVPLFYPILLGASLLLWFIAERIIGRKIPGCLIIPWSLPVILAVIFARPRNIHPSTVEVFREFASDDVPGSLSNFQYWWQQLPGDDEWVFSFRLDPSEFNKTLSRHKFEESTDKEEMQSTLKEYFAPDGSPWRDGLRISLPKASLVRMYHYSKDDAGDGPHIMDVFTNATRDTVIIVGDN